MGGVVKMLFIFIVLVFLALWLYLAKYATKADVFAWERSYGIHLPLWMKELPKTTGEIQNSFSEGKAAFTGEIEEWKTSAKAEFNVWLDDLKKDAQDKAKQQANQWIDKKFGSGN